MLHGERLRLAALKRGVSAQGSFLVPLHMFPQHLEETSCVNILFKNSEAPVMGLLCSEEPTETGWSA